MRRTQQLSGRAKTAYIERLAQEAARAASTDECVGTLAARADQEIVRVWVRAPDTATLPLPGTKRPLTTRDEPAAAEAFNPYAFSAMAVLLAGGRTALEARLAPIVRREDVAALAAAQSVSLDAKLLDDPRASLDTLKKAFVAAVEKRVAHRRAVALPVKDG
jgi:hypothetical protein